MNSKQIYLAPKAPIPGLNGVNVNQLFAGLFHQFDKLGPCPCNKNCLCLDLGKKGVKEFCTLFGGRVVDNISGKTDFLVIGSVPSSKKVKVAESKPKMKIITIQVILLFVCILIFDAILILDCIYNYKSIII